MISVRYRCWQPVVQAQSVTSGNTGLEWRHVSLLSLLGIQNSSRTHAPVYGSTFFQPGTHGPRELTLLWRRAALTRPAKCCHRELPEPTQSGQFNGAAHLMVRDGTALRRVSVALQLILRNGLKLMASLVILGKDSSHATERYYQ